MGLFALFNIRKQKPKNPEEDYIVVIDDEQIAVTYPDGIREKVLWKDIQQIKLINTDWGPISPDIWLTLIGSNEKCMIRFCNAGVSLRFFGCIGSKVTAPFSRGLL